MVLSRVNPGPVVAGHFRSLSNRRRNGQWRPDWPLRLGMPLAALVPAGFAWLDSWRLPAATALLTGVGLMAGASLSSFAYLATLRLRLTDRPDDRWLDVERDSIDEGATHMLMALLLSVVDGVVLVVGQNAAPLSNVSGGISAGGWTIAAIALSSYMAAIFVVIVPRLFAAYTEMNDVRAEISGLASSLRDEPTPRRR